MPDEMTVRHVYPALEDRVRIKLVKNSKGYGWEITVAEKHAYDALCLLQDVERRVQEAFGGGEA